MSFQAQMSGADMSNAEIKVWTALNKRGIRRFDTKRKIPLKWTIPDFFWEFDGSTSCNGLAVYLDGISVHKDRDRDEDITTRLEKMHFKVLRWRYRPPLTDKLLEEIVSTIESELQKATVR